MGATTATVDQEFVMSPGPCPGAVGVGDGIGCCLAGGELGMDQ